MGRPGVQGQSHGGHEGDVRNTGLQVEDGRHLDAGTVGPKGRGYKGGQGAQESGASWSIDPTAWIHPAATVENATVGARSKVWQYATVALGTVLGMDCNVGACAVLTGPRFGDRCKISSGVVMGPGFLFGSDCFIGPNCVLANDVWPDADPDGYDDEAMRAGGRLAVIVGSRVIIGANAVILPGVTIGDMAVIAAGAVCSRDVPANMVWRRDGELTERPADWREKRMRWAC